MVPLRDVEAVVEDILKEEGKVEKVLLLFVI
jgi:hypothetical protein